MREETWGCASITYGCVQYRPVSRFAASCPNMHSCNSAAPPDWSFLFRIATRCRGPCEGLFAINKSASPAWPRSRLHSARNVSRQSTSTVYFGLDASCWSAPLLSTDSDQRTSILSAVVRSPSDLLSFIMQIQLSQAQLPPLSQPIPQNHPPINPHPFSLSLLKPPSVLASIFLLSL